MARENIIGIDLGTTFSSVAQLKEGRAVPIENAEGEYATPSVVFIDENGVTVGTEAEKLAGSDPGRVIRHPKRFLGDGDRAWEIDGTRYSPVDVSAFILRRLKKDAEERIGPIRKAVVTVPAHFDAQRRDLTKKAAKRAGLEVLALCNEPVAAGIAYVFGAEEGEEDLGLAFGGLLDDQLFAVYDLGGGTFDLSIVKYSDDQFEVLATTGDLMLGGIDWNQRMIDQLAKRFAKEHGFDPRDEGESFEDLAKRVEDAKRSLSSPRRDSTRVLMRYGDPPKKSVYTVTRADFEKWTSDLVERTRQLTRDLLAGHGGNAVEMVVVVGGSSRMPMIGNMIDILPGISRNKKLSPDLSIAIGAAYYAGLVQHDSGGADLDDTARERLENFGVSNVNAHDLGVILRDKTGQYYVHPLIAANTQLPASERLVVSTVLPNQNRIRVKIVEGDGDGTNGSDDVICVCTLANLPPKLPKDSKFDVNVSLDEEGLLQVVAQHRDTGLLATVRHDPQKPGGDDET